MWFTSEKTTALEPTLTFKVFCWWGGGYKFYYGGLTWYTTDFHIIEHRPVTDLRSTAVLSVQNLFVFVFCLYFQVYVKMHWSLWMLHHILLDLHHDFEVFKSRQQHKNYSVSALSLLHFIEYHFEHFGIYFLHYFEYVFDFNLLINMVYSRR